MAQSRYSTMSGTLEKSSFHATNFQQKHLESYGKHCRVAPPLLDVCGLLLHPHPSFSSFPETASHAR